MRAQLNYQHLYYFWIVAREGGVTRAAERLRLSPSTVSTQLRQLEEILEAELFLRTGRGLVLSEAGRIAFQYAQPIFGLGEALIDALAGRGRPGIKRLTIGVADHVPKLVARALLDPVSGPDTHLVCRTDNTDKLLAELALHQLDVVIVDAPLGGETSVRAFSHLLGESAIWLYATPQRAARLREGFPQSLNGQPLLLPTPGATLRRGLDHWLTDEGLSVEIAGEFDDSALLKEFGAIGLGAFPAPAIVAEGIGRQYGVEPIGEVVGVRERFYAVSLERKLTDPRVVALIERAQISLFEGVSS
ncbi:LysR family transcriptional regulator [Myxococcota bacterium]|nr:LysR family transcriptional regulator [Myxococcota bacterium]